jgi:hypothetical protein
VALQADTILPAGKVLFYYLISIIYSWFTVYDTMFLTVLLNFC